MTKTMRENLKETAFGKLLPDGQIFYKGKGCSKCSGSGYSGRISINEVLQADENIRAAILRKAPESEIKKIAASGGMTTMLEDGLEKVKKGETTIEEILRVIQE